MRARRPLERQLRAEREQRGTGHDADYRAYIQIRRHEFPSRGRSHYVPSILTERHMHLLSDLELHVLWHLQMLNPTEIREGYPLQLIGVESEFDWSDEPQGTVEIASMLGVRHPAHSADAMRRFTTDFLVTLRNGELVAIHVKYRKDLDSVRLTALRKIEEEYWRVRRVKFLVITEEHINRTAVGNLAMFASVDRNNIALVDKAVFLHWLASHAGDIAMNKLLNAASLRLGKSYASLVNLVKLTSLLGILRTDLTKGVLRWDSTWPAMRVNLELRNLLDA